MIYLILEIVSFVVFSCMLKASGVAGCKREAVALVNYSIALLTFVTIWFINDKPAFDSTTIICGIVGGFTWVAGLVLMMEGMKRVGIAITSTASKLGVALPIAFSILLWGETPALYQGIGILLVFAAIAVLSTNSPSGDKRLRWNRALLVSLVWLSCGGAHLIMTIFKHTGDSAQKPSFLIVLFSTAVLLSLGWMIKSGGKPSGKDILFGMAVGLPNAMTGFFLVTALEYLPGIIVFPVNSAAGFILITVLGGIIWKEKLSRRAILGILIAVAAVVLVTVK